jgi:hypothetical protein
MLTLLQDGYQSDNHHRHHHSSGHSYCGRDFQQVPIERSEGQGVQVDLSVSTITLMYHTRAGSAMNEYNALFIFASNGITHQLRSMRWTLANCMS